jgi:hypothetical protein
MTGVPLRPVDLPRLRDRLLDFADTPTAAELRAFYVEVQGCHPDGEVAKILLQPAPGLADAPLFFVTAEMCELATTAAKALPEFVLDVDDPPSPSGFLWFDTPIEDMDSEDERLPFYCVALGWIVKAGRLWVSTYVDRDTFPWGDRRIPDGWPQVIPMGCWPAPIDGDGHAAPYEGESGRTILATLKTVWLLMRQPLAEISDAVYDRAARRRIKRQGKTPPPIRVIGLRHPPSTADGEASTGREWHHRWIVRGHWRMAAVGEGRQQRRPVWVSPHVKGPADAPLIGGEKVYVVKADPRADAA